MRRNSAFKLNSHRRGVTLIEVMFATGIAIIGLLGIASLLPIAARSAKQAAESSEGQSHGQRFYSEFMTRGFNDRTRWRIFNDAGSPGHYYNPADPTSDVEDTLIGSTGGDGGSISTPYQHAICIDPGFYADALTSSGFSSATGAYRPALFPYYHDNFDPTSNPVTPSSLGGNRPRLLRVGLSAAPGATGVMPSKFVEQLFLSRDDLVMSLPEDATLPAVRRYQTILDSDGNETLIQGLAKAEYSWLATLFPNHIASTSEVGEPARFYTLSIVVMHRRERAWFQPDSGAADATDFPQGERVLNVSPGADFRGGDGGTITVSANLAIDDKIGVGDWMLLTRYQNTGAARGIVGRWYRVIAVDSDASIEPTGWSRSVTLEGPDWVFSSNPPTPPTPPTQATLVSNAVTVFERSVPVE